MRLTYFAGPGGRAEPSRIALHIAGVDYEDDRFVNGAGVRGRRGWRPSSRVSSPDAFPQGPKLRGLGGRAQSEAAVWSGSLRRAKACLVSTIHQPAPLAQVPVLSVGESRVTQSSAILRYVGRMTGLYPEDPLLAAQVDEVDQVRQLPCEARCPVPMARCP